MSDATSSQRIVPDVDQSLGAQHLRHRRAPSLWPLWLMVLLLIALLGALVAGLWYERERLLDEFHRVSGEVSNLHARLDSGDTDVADSVTYLQAQMTTLFQEQEQLAVQLTNTREEFYAVLTGDDEFASNEALGEIRQELDALNAAATLNDRQLEALRTSLGALERAGTSGRQNLMQEVDYLEQSASERIAALEERLTREREDVEARLAEWGDTLDGQLAALSENTDDREAIDQQALDTLSERLLARITALESDLRQVRQAQLAFSAQMEMLR
ncbi:MULTISPECIES: hypothetical protein [unclassified Halomonas]|uniref:hypothetical protein n=1 Tax=unclassified Halomonas TaxID=2609666 RepID=UPI00209C907F|nr:MULTISPECIES: hypothetical protein [unclassified Halomonas]MCP1314273.1 hypothetical protein [Halomonas sp. 707D7]MCP1327696.1 hypothetical protein [Halomonas sp. 707D4]